MNVEIKKIYKNGFSDKQESERLSQKLK